MQKLKQQKAERSNLSFYTSVPDLNLDYGVFKSYVLERLSLLRRLENNSKISVEIKSYDEDLLAHFCLRLVCCKSKQATLWFINSETQLFRIRLEQNFSETKKFFFEKIWPHFKFRSNNTHSIDNALNNRSNITSNSIHSSNNTFSIDFESEFDPSFENKAKFNQDCQIHFTKCSEILSRRIFRLNKGYYEYNDELLKPLLITEFRKYLTRKVEQLYLELLNSVDDMLSILNSELFLQQINSEKTTILTNIDKFPLCIKGLILRFKNNKHLKYNDRQTLCLFLKDIGVPLEETVKFFRSNFKLESDKFEKEYLYNIRHNYGLEGKRANYTSFTCNKIISLTNDSNTFGCPFVKNVEFIKSHSEIDLEDFGKDPKRDCLRHSCSLKQQNVPKIFNTPAEYYKILKKAEEETKN